MVRSARLHARPFWGGRKGGCVVQGVGEGCRSARGRAGVTRERGGAVLRTSTLHAGTCPGTRRWVTQLLTDYPLASHRKL